MWIDKEGKVWVFKKVSMDFEDPATTSLLLQNSVLNTLNKTMPNINLAFVLGELNSADMNTKMNNSANNILNSQISRQGSILN